MISKEYILKILNKLESYRPMTKGLKVLLDQDKLDEKTIQGLIAVFEQSIKEATDKKQAQKLQNSLDIIKKIQASEKEENEKENQNLDQMLDNI